MSKSGSNIQDTERSCSVEKAEIDFTIETTKNWHTPICLLDTVEKMSESKFFSFVDEAGGFLNRNMVFV